MFEYKQRKIYSFLYSGKTVTELHSPTLACVSLCQAAVCFQAKYFFCTGEVTRCSEQFKKTLHLAYCSEQLLFTGTKRSTLLESTWLGSIIWHKQQRANEVQPVILLDKHLHGVSHVSVLIVPEMFQ